MIIVPDRWKVANQKDFPAAVIKKLDAWYTYVSNVEWRSPHDVLQSYSKADPLKNGRVVFDIGKYRLVVKINYEAQAVQVRFFDHHDEYDKIDANTI